MLLEKKCIYLIFIPSNIFEEKKNLALKFTLT